MSFNYHKVITAAALLAIPGTSFADETTITIDDAGDMRINLVETEGESRALIFIPGDGENVLRVGAATSNSGGIILDEQFTNFTGDIYIETAEGEISDVVEFNDVSIPGNVNILTREGDDTILVTDSVLGGLDVRARDGNDFFLIDGAIFNGSVVLMGQSGEDQFVINENSFLGNTRIRGGGDNDTITVDNNIFGGSVTRFNGRVGEDTLFHADNAPRLTDDNFRNLEVTIDNTVETFQIGDTGPGGGIVFSVSADGSSGLEAAPVDQSAGVIWCNVNGDIPGIENGQSFSPDSNSGASNTAILVPICGDNSAAGVAAAYTGPDGSTDGWFLPNRQELGLLNRAIGERCDEVTNPGCNVANLVRGGDYWSSSEAPDPRQAIGVPASNALTIEFFGFRATPERVRAIREF